MGNKTRIAGTQNQFYNGLDEKEVDAKIAAGGGSASRYPSLSNFLAEQDANIQNATSVVSIGTPKKIDPDFTFDAVNNRIVFNFDGYVIIDFTAFVYTDSTAVNHNVDVTVRKSGVADKLFNYEYDNDETDDFPSSPRTYSWGMDVLNGQYLDFLGFADSDSRLSIGSVIRLLRTQ